MESLHPNQREELLSLVSDYCDGTVSAARGNRLEDLLRSGDAARLVYVEYLRLHLALRANQSRAGGRSSELLDGALTAAQLAELEDRFHWDDAFGPSAHEAAAPQALRPQALRPCELDRTGQLEPESHVLPPPSGLDSSAAGERRSGGILGFLSTTWDALDHSPRTLFLLLAAVLGAYFIVTLALVPLSRWNESRRLAQRSASPVDDYNSTPGADIGSLASDGRVSWSAGAVAPHDRIVRVGQKFELADGRAIVVLRLGTQLAVEGPAVWRFASNQRLVLDSGRIVARVPKPAIGFTVNTPTAELIDLGTEFAVEVDAQGRTDLQVSRGQVEVKPAPPARRRNVVVAGEAVQLSDGARSVTAVPFDESRFANLQSSLAALPPVAGSAGVQFPSDQPIWLGNLFDDNRQVSLAAAMRTDTFRAPAEFRSLGVERICLGGEPVRPIAPGVTFDLGKLGWEAGYISRPVNDAWTDDTARWSEIPNDPGGGIRTLGKRMSLSEPKIEEGIGMLPNALVTFDLEDIIAAGGLRGRALEFQCDRAGLNDSVADHPQSSVHLAVILSGDAGIQTVVVDGRPVETAQTDKTWTITSEIGPPLRADGRFATFRIPLAPDAKWLTLVSTSAGDAPHADAAVWSGPRLNVGPEN